MLPPDSPHPGGAAPETRHEALFRARFVDSAVPQGLLDATGRIEQANEALAALLGVAASGLVDASPSAFVHSIDSGAADALLEAIRAGEQRSAAAERILCHASGRPVPVLVHYNAVEQGGRLVGIAAHFQDLRVLRDSEHRLRQQEQFFAALGARSQDAGLLCDPTGHLVYVSPAVQTMFGHDPAEIASLDGWSFVHDDDTPAAQAVFERVVASGGTATAVFRVRTAAGDWRWVESTMTNLVDTPIGGVVCNLVDITGRRAAEERLRRAEARNRAIVDTAQEGIWLVGTDGRTDFVNQAMADMLGRDLEALYAGKPADLLSGDEAAQVRVRVRDRAQRGPERYEVSYDHPDGTRRIFQVVATAMEYGDGAFVGSLAMVTDITASRRLEEQLRRAALHDPLTGLPNRSLLTDRLDQAMLRRTEDGGVVAVLFVDVDGFKLVNDSHGHAVGDEVLRAVADRIGLVADSRDTVARVGADEFVILAARDEPAHVDLLADRLHATFATPVDIDRRSVHVSVSVGVATAPPVAPADLIRFADIALYDAKAGGRGEVRHFDPRLVTRAKTDYEIATDLRTAIASDQLAVNYQPIVDLGTGAVVGYEALARWTHPRLGAVPPSTFVPLADRVGLGGEFERWVLQRAMAEFADIRRRGSVPPEAHLAVNLRGASVGDPAVTTLVQDTAAGCGLPPHLVVLEITEGSVVGDLGRAIAELSRLRLLGFRVAIDDFGTGYSTLSYLRDLPINTLKIDRSFVADMKNGTDAHAIVSSIVQLARTVGLLTVAEGCEEVVQAAELRRLGCDFAQGWLWSPAVPGAELADLPRRFPAPPLRTAIAARKPAPVEQLKAEHGLDRLLDLQREGASLATIAAALNLEGYRTPAGTRWHRLSVARALSNLGG